VIEGLTLRKPRVIVSKIEQTISPLIDHLHEQPTDCEERKQVLIFKNARPEASTEKNVHLKRSHLRRPRSARLRKSKVVLVTEAGDQIRHLTQKRPQWPSSASPTQLNANIEDATATADARMTIVLTDNILRSHCT
jgi:hypothetical protein